MKKMKVLLFVEEVFPLIIHDELRGSILVSGLVHDEDHQVIVDCLRKLKDEGTCK